MRYTVLGAIAWLVMAGAASAQPPNAEVTAPIKKFLDNFNKGDAAGAAAAQLLDDDYAIIDEVPPHLWRGKNGFQAWAADLEADGKKNGMTGMMVTLAAPSRSVVGADTAYVVVPATFTYKQGGKAMKE